MARKKRFAPNDNNLAIAYYRFSSHSQNDASIDQQRELAHDWADAHGFKIVQEYEDAAISGTTDARPGFQQMLSEVAKIRPHTLIMWKTDRLGRDKYVLAMAKKKIRDAGCEIHLLVENILGVLIQLAGHPAGADGKDQQQHLCQKHQQQGAQDLAKDRAAPPLIRCLFFHPCFSLLSAP